MNILSVLALSKYCMVENDKINSDDFFLTCVDESPVFQSSESLEFYDMLDYDKRHKKNLALREEAWNSFTF